MSKIKIQNTATDLVLFALYHAVAVFGTFAFFIGITRGVDSLKLGSISYLKEKIQGQSESKVIVSGPIISSIRGEVLVSERGKKFVVAVDGQGVKEGSVIETKERSTAVISFGENYKCRVRISASSRINIDTLLFKDEVNKTESTLFNLVKGGIYLLLENESKEADLRVKTFSNVFAVRGTNFAVITDGLKNSVLGVKEGNVEAENLKTSKKTTIYGGSSYLADLSGAEKVNNDPGVLDKFNFDDSSEAVVPKIEDISPIIGEITSATGPVVDPTIAEKGKLKEIILAEIAAFKKENDQIAIDVEAEKNDFDNMKLKHKDELPKLNNDMHCIENSVQPCKLYSQELLVSRGFPRTHGDPRVRRSLIQDLRKYIEEQESKLAEKESYIKNTVELSVKRTEVLKWAEESLANETNVEQIIPRLQDRQLQR